MSRKRHARERLAAAAGFPLLTQTHTLLEAPVGPKNSLIFVILAPPR